MMARKQLAAKNGAVAYWTNDRPGREQALFFLHGLTADHTMFERQISYFGEKHKVLCWDAPAHGQSRPFSDFSYRGAAEYLKAILEKEHIERAVLIGQSMGGYIAQTFLKYHPGLAAGFVGIDTTPFGLSYYSASDRFWLRQIGWMSRCFPYKALVSSIAGSCTCTPHARENMLTALRHYKKKELCHLLGAGYSEFLKENCDLALGIPVLILVGENDRTGKVLQYCEAWHEKTGYPLHVIKNAAHNSNIDNYAQVNEEIERFLEGLEW